MPDPCIRLPKPEVLHQRLTNNYWRRKYKVGDCFVGSHDSYKILMEYFETIKKKK